MLDMESEKHIQNEDYLQRLLIGIKQVKAVHGSKSNHSPETEKDGGD